jgi:hypothetical protein
MLNECIGDLSLAENDSYAKNLSHFERTEEAMWRLLMVEWAGDQRLIKASGPQVVRIGQLLSRVMIPKLAGQRCGGIRSDI